MLKKSYILNFIIDAKFKYKIKYSLFLSWDWEAWCMPQSGGRGVIPLPPERNTAWNKGRKYFHCLGAPNNLIRPCLEALWSIEISGIFVTRGILEKNDLKFTKILKSIQCEDNNKITPNHGQNDCKDLVQLAQDSEHWWDVVEDTVA